MIPETELNNRMQRLRGQLTQSDPGWRQAVIMGKVNLYYLTGTMPSGALIIPRDGEPTLWVRRSFSRARRESPLPDIREMRSFRELAAAWQPAGHIFHLEKDVVTLGHLERFAACFAGAEFAGLDRQIAAVRAVKSDWEVAIMRRCGELHRATLEERVPQMLREGMSEAELGTRVFSELMAGGHHGVARIGMFDTELLTGNFCFGESAVATNPFDGPGGLRGLCPAVPLFGSRERKLKRGDLVFVDVGCGVEGYHTDKTMVYAFGFAPPPEMQAAHDQCVAIQNRAAAALRPGTAAAAVHAIATRDLPAGFTTGFMGLGDQQVKFLGHGVGLVIDERPVIVPGCDDLLEANMTIALEPKVGFPGIGMVGVENTFLVTPDGGVSLTGNHPGLMPVEP